MRWKAIRAGNWHFHSATLKGNVDGIGTYFSIHCNKTMKAASCGLVCTRYALCRKTKTSERKQHNSSSARPSSMPIMVPAGVWYTSALCLFRYFHHPPHIHPPTQPPPSFDFTPELRAKNHSEIRPKIPFEQFITKNLVATHATILVQVETATLTEKSFLDTALSLKTEKKCISLWRCKMNHIVAPPPPCYMHGSHRAVRTKTPPLYRKRATYGYLYHLATKHNRTPSQINLK